MPWVQIMGPVPICANNLDKLLDFLNFKFLICPRGLVKKKSKWRNTQILTQPRAREPVTSSSYVRIILRSSLPWDFIRVLSMLKAGLRSLCGVSSSLAPTKGSLVYGWSGTLHRTYSRESCLQSEMNNGSFRNKARILLLKSPWLSTRWHHVNTRAKETRGSHTASFKSISSLPQEPNEETLTIQLYLNYSLCWV